MAGMVRVWSKWSMPVPSGSLESANLTPWPFGQVPAPSCAQLRNAMHFAIAHDDGAKDEDWGEADALIMGVSRVGKSPLCMFMATMGYKVANYPVCKGVPLPSAINNIDRKRGMVARASAARNYVEGTGPRLSRNAQPSTADRQKCASPSSPGGWENDVLRLRWRTSSRIRAVRSHIRVQLSLAMTLRDMGLTSANAAHPPKGWRPTPGECV